MGEYPVGARKRAGKGKGRAALYVIAAAISLFASGSADAFKIDTGNDDVNFNWDNSLRYNLGYRIGSTDPNIINSPNNDDGDRNFNKGIVGNRLDVLSELDLSYQKRLGVRFSGALWYDQAYHTHLNNKSVATSNTIRNGQQVLGYNDYVKRYYAGPSGELLDAFAFGRFEAGQIPVQVKVGRQTQYWGESLLVNAALNGIAYAQSPLDIAKGYAVPNTSIKELFRPLNQVYVTAEPIEHLTVMAQYFLQWEPNRYPEPGTYLGIYDFLLNSAQSILNPDGTVALLRGRDIEPSQARDWGIGLRWSPDWLDGTVGLYYRNFSDRMPQAHVDTDNGELRFAYPSGIDLVGVSLSKQVLGVSVGAEFSYRHNMPLQSVPVAVAAADLPHGGGTRGARGDTLHALLNVLGVITKTPVFDTAQYIVEFNWGNWMTVNQGADVFKGSDSYQLIDRITKNWVSVDVNFAPTFFQVFPGADLTLPMTYSRGLIGNSPTGIMQKDAGTWSVGASIDFQARHKFDLTYVGYFGDYSVDPVNGLVNNGDPALLKDRDTLSLTYRYTF